MTKFKPRGERCAACVKDGDCVIEISSAIGPFKLRLYSRFSIREQQFGTKWYSPALYWPGSIPMNKNALYLSFTVVVSACWLTGVRHVSTAHISVEDIALGIEDQVSYSID